MSKYTTNAEDSKPGDGMNEREYTRFIINALTEGSSVPSPEFIAIRAGVYAPLLELIMEGYDPNELEFFKSSLAALKRKQAEAFKSLEQVDTSTDQPATDPDYITTAGGKQAFKRLAGNDIWNLPDIEWLVSGILQRTTTTLVVGTGNVGKTFMWLDACMSIAYGDKWLGRKTRQGRVLYIYAEGRGGLKQRYKAWMIEHGKATLHGITSPTDQISFIPRPVNLLTDKETLFSTIEDESQMPEEVVIDTFSMCAGGVDENSNSQVALYLATASEIKLKYGCHVTIIHHCNKSGGFRGASALRDNVDTMITLDREDETGPIKVKCDKQRDADFFPSFKLNLKVVELGINSFTNEPITSCVVELFDGEDSSAKNVMPEKQIKMLEILKIHGSLTSSVWQKRCLEEGDIAKATFNRNLEKLLEAGKVQKTEYMSGKQKRISYSLTTTDQASEECEDEDE